MPHKRLVTEVEIACTEYQTMEVECGFWSGTGVCFDECV